MHEPAERGPERRRDAGALAARQRPRRDVKDSRTGDRGNDSERKFWVKALERGEIGDSDLDHAIGLMTKHRALEDTISRAQHYGAMAVDALALFPASPMKTALEQVVAFCLARSH